MSDSTVATCKFAIMDCKTPPKLPDEDSTAQARKHSMADRLSSLPDEILLRILELSPMRDAVATGILSRRWRNFWKSCTFFKFDPLSRHGVYKRDPITLISEIDVKRSRMKRYADWVDWVFAQLQQLKRLEELWICSDFCTELGGDAYLERWLSFALERKVRKLNINLVDDDGYSSCWKRCVFPPPNLSEEKASSVTQLCLKGVEIPPGLSIFSSLASLTLSCVTLTDDFCQTAFSNCLLLEHLHLWAVQNLVSLKLVGSSLSLKHLELYHCLKLTDVEINAPNLVSFTYATSVKTRIAFESVPKLVTACFSAQYVRFHWKESQAIKNNISYFFDQLDGISTQLESLVLEINAMEVEARRRPVLCPTFLSLKTLALFVDTIDDLIRCIGLPCLLVEACPMLQKFELHQSRGNDGVVEQLESSEELLKASLSSSTHRCLKEIVVSGFLGQSYDMVLLEYLIRTAVSLEKLTIIAYAKYVGLHKGAPVKYCFNSKSQEEIQNARQVARKLCMELLPHMAQITIL